MRGGKSNTLFMSAINSKVLPTCVGVNPKYQLNLKVKIRVLPTCVGVNLFVNLSGASVGGFSPRAWG